MFMKYKALLFDFDGVVANTFEHHLDAWKQILSFEPDGLTIRMNEGRPGWQIACALFEQAGQTISEEMGRHWITEKNKIFSARGNIKVYPEIPKILDAAKEAGMQAGLVTGTHLGNVKAILSESLLNQFSVIITDKDTERGKPYPDQYLEAVKRLDLTPNECIVVENAPLGIDAAKAAETECYALETTLSGELLTKADVIFRNHALLYDHIIRLTTRG